MVESSLGPLLRQKGPLFAQNWVPFLQFMGPLEIVEQILYLNPPTNQINLPQLIRSHKKGLNPPTITLFP